MREREAKGRKTHDSSNFRNARLETLDEGTLPEDLDVPRSSLVGVDVEDSVESGDHRVGGRGRSSDDAEEVGSDELWVERRKKGIDASVSKRGWTRREKPR